MFLSLLYIVLIGLLLVELAVVTWTVNFVRKYAFRPNPDLAHGHAAHEWSPQLQVARISQPPRTARVGARRESAAGYEDELFDRNRRH